MRTFRGEVIGPDDQPEEYTDTELLELIFTLWETQEFGETFGFGHKPLNRETLTEFISEYNS
jgi:hypothetical protein